MIGRDIVLVLIVIIIGVTLAAYYLGDALNSLFTSLAEQLAEIR